MGKLSGKQRAVIAALLRGENVTDAAAEVGVNRATVHRWLVDDDFKRALQVGSDDAIQQAARRLAGMVDRALDTIAEILDGASGPGAGARLRAADMVVSHALRLSEHADILERLAQLEARL